jgi:hypothetical protein
MGVMNAWVPADQAIVHPGEAGLATAETGMAVA